MHELLVGIEDMAPRVNGEEIRFRPAGRILFAATEAVKRDKWAEILCNLADPRPRKRADGKFDPSKRELYEAARTPIQQSLGARWGLIKEQWTPQAHGRWFEAERIPEGHQEKAIAKAFLWSEIEKSGIRSALGRDPTGVVDLLETWLWSEMERKIHLVATNADMTETEAVASAAVIVERSGSGRERRVSHYPSRIIRWDTDLDFTRTEKSNIRNKKKIVHPRFDRPFQKTVLRAPIERAR